MSRVRDFIQVLSGFRKFSIMLLVIIAGVLFRITDLITGAEFIDLIKVCTVSFMGTNAAEHMTGVIKDWIASKSKSMLPKGELND